MLSLVDATEKAHQIGQPVSPPLLGAGENMYSTFPVIKNITPAVLKAVAESKGLTSEQYRIGTLKRCECELLNLKESAQLTAEEIEVIDDLVQQVQIAIGGE